MEKEPPPPYSSANAYPPAAAPGFVPPNQNPPSQFQGYPPQGMPMQAHHLQGPQGYGVQQGQTTVVVTTVPVISQFGPTPQPLTCPHCHHQITTNIVVEPGMKTHLFALILCMFGCIPCAVLPYCVDSCQNRNHYCPSCGAFVGCYNADELTRPHRGYW